MKIAIISGSSRTQNSSFRLAKAIENYFIKEGDSVSLIDFKDYDIPFLNVGTLHPDSLSPFQKEMVDSMDRAQLIIIVSPEYNWFPSAELVNMIHQLGNARFKHLFENKVYAFAGVSSGRGGRIPTIQLGYVMDKLFNVFKTKSITSPKKFEAQFINKVLDENGASLGNPEFDNGLEEFNQYSKEVTQRWVI